VQAVTITKTEGPRSMFPLSCMSAQLLSSLCSCNNA